MKNSSVQVKKKKEGSYDQEESCVLFDKPVSNPGFEFDQYFIGWNVKAPLEVIYEAYEGEEEDEDDHSNENESMHEKDYDHGFELNIGFGLERFNSLSKYYPETDSDCSSDRDFPVRAFCWDSPESVCFEWEEEDREDSLIEIALDHYVKKDSWCGIHFEEDNLIEIDISHKKYGM